MELKEILESDDPELLKEYVMAELRRRIEVKVRADDMRYERLLFYGTNTSGDRIIPYA